MVHRSGAKGNCQIDLVDSNLFHWEARPVLLFSVLYGLLNEVSVAGPEGTPRAAFSMDVWRVLDAGTGEAHSDSGCGVAGKLVNVLMPKWIETRMSVRASARFSLEYPPQAPRLKCLTPL